MSYNHAARLADKLDAIGQEFRETDGCQDVAPDLVEAAATIRTLLSQVEVAPDKKSWPYSAFIPALALIMIVVLAQWWLGHPL